MKRDRERGTAFARLYAEAERTGLRTCVYIAPSANMRAQHSKLSGIALVDRDGQPVYQASLAQDDRLDEAAKDLLHDLAAKR